MKKLLSTLLLSCLIISSTKTYENWKKDASDVAVGVGIVGLVCAIGVGIGDLIASLFTAQAYYHSEKDAYRKVKNEIHMKKLLSTLLLSCFIISSTKTYENWKKDASNVAVGVGIAGFVCAIGVGIRKLIASQFTAQAYYHSAKDTYCKAKLVGIYEIQSLDDLKMVIQNNIKNWQAIILSDCYLVDIYHLFGKYIESLSVARDYIKTAFGKSDCNYALEKKLSKLQTKIDHLHQQYVSLRSFCELHPLFNQHMVIYREKERIWQVQRTSIEQVRIKTF